VDGNSVFGRYLRLIFHLRFFAGYLWQDPTDFRSAESRIRPARLHFRSGLGREAHFQQQPLRAGYSAARLEQLEIREHVRYHPRILTSLNVFNEFCFDCRKRHERFSERWRRLQRLRGTESWHQFQAIQRPEHPESADGRQPPGKIKSESGVS
jgi:hypothetical protein